MYVFNHACFSMSHLERMQSRRGQHRRPGCDSVDYRYATHLSFSYFLFWQCVKKSVTGTAFGIQQASSWAECGHGCTGVWKDNGTNWRRMQSAADFLSSGGGGAQKWHEPLIPEDISVTLQVIWVTSLPVLCLFFSTLMIWIPVSPCFSSLINSVPANRSSGFKLKSPFVLQVF